MKRCHIRTTRLYHPEMIRMHKNRIFNILRIQFAILMTFLGIIQAETWFVYHNIAESGTGISWEQSKKTIHEALENCLPGDTILVGFTPETPAVYALTRSIEILYPLKIRSAVYMEDMKYDACRSDSSLCILDGQNLRRVFWMTSRYVPLFITPSNTTIYGFTIQNGNASVAEERPGFGGGVCIAKNASPTISHCAIRNNTGSELAELPGYGGGICCSGDSAAPTLISVTVTQNTGSEFSAGFGGGIALLNAGSLNLVLSHITNNTASAGETASGQGGGIYCEGSSPSTVITLSTFRHNTASLNQRGYGGGIFLTDSAGAKILTCEIDSNSASGNTILYPGHGGGLCIHGEGTDPLIEGNSFQGNYGSKASAGYGGAIAVLHGARGILQNNLMSGNTASASMTASGKGGGVFCGGHLTAPFLLSNTIQKNIASLYNTGYGGGLCAADSANPAIQACTLDSNIATESLQEDPSGYGGGLCVTGDSTHITFQSNTITQNVAARYTKGYGGGIAFLQSATGQFSGNQLNSNVASQSYRWSGWGGGIYCAGSGTDPSISLNTISANTASTETRGHGGGICVQQNAVPSITGNIILENLASGNSAGYGGGVSCGDESTYLEMNSNQIQKNVSSVNASGFGGGIYIYDGATVMGYENKFSENSASQSALDLGSGGAVCIENQTAFPVNIIMQENRFEMNTANQNGHGRGGALSCRGSGPCAVSLQTNLFLQNRGTGSLNLFGWGGAVFLDCDNLKTLIRNNNFFNNYEDSTLNIDGQGSIFYLATSLPDTSIRNNLCMIEDTLTGIAATAFYSTVANTVTHNAIFGYANRYNNLVTSLHAVHTDPRIDKETMIPEMDSPLIDAGFDPVLNMNETYTGWFVDIGIEEYKNNEITQWLPPSQPVSYGGNIRCRIQDTAYPDSIQVTIKSFFPDHHRMAFGTLPRWYRITCEPDIPGSGNLILSYTDEDCLGSDEHTLRMWHFDPADNEWNGPLFSESDTLSNWIKAPFSTLSGDWVITDARDLNALAADQCQIGTRILSEGILIEWRLGPHPEILTTRLWRSENDESFIILEGASESLIPGQLFQDFSYLDETAEPENHYQYKLEMIHRNGRSVFSETVNAGTPGIPEKTELLHNFPNPFNHETRIHFTLSGSEEVSINIWNIYGRLVRNLTHRAYSAGVYQIKWDGTDEAGQPVSSGIYYYRLMTPTYQKWNKMMYIR